MARRRWRVQVTTTIILRGVNGDLAGGGSRDCWARLILRTAKQKTDGRRGHVHQRHHGSAGVEMACADQNTVRVFSEGVPSNERTRRQTCARRLAGKTFEFRQWRASSMKPGAYVPQLILVAFLFVFSGLPPRSLFRGGDHRPFSSAAFAAVRFTETKKTDINPVGEDAKTACNLATLRSLTIPLHRHVAAR